MCGIAGYFGQLDHAAPARVRRMLEAQRHRGPDGAGMAHCTPRISWQTSFAPSPSALPAPGDPAQCVLGHNLLAIQDRSNAARQPMLAGELALVFNGEIYNFVELRAQLQSDGVRFATEGDTEVLLALWKRHGAACLHLLRGMFALALADRQTRTLWAARDPFGIKPLYYASRSDGLVFASEIRAIHASGIVRRALRPDAAVASAAAGINAFGDELTLYEGVFELPPGHLLKLSEAGREVQTYVALADPRGDLTGASASLYLRQATEESVRLHLRSRRKIATCLSGGLDSSALACLIGKELGPASHDFQTFTICTSGPNDSELAPASDAARAAGLCHVLVTPSQIQPDDVMEMIVAYEVPNHVIGPINQFLLLREISRAGVTVVLDGQGGDELLSGYPWYAPVLLRAIRARGADTSTIEDALKRQLPLDPGTMDAFTRMFHDPREWVKAFVWQGDFLGWSIDRILALPETQYYLDGGGDWAAFRRREYQRAELRYLLRQEDRLGMWFGLECRVPLVDAPLIDVARRIDPAWLMHDGYFKYPFRDMLPELPPSVRWNTTKRGFWETRRENFPWIRELGRQRVCDSRFLCDLFPSVERLWDTLSFDQHWRLLQLAVLERGNIED